MNEIERYTHAAPGRSTPWTAIGLGIVGLGLLVLGGAIVGGIIAMQPEPPTPTPDVEATGRAVRVATEQAEATATAARYATEQAIAAATADAAARATQDARATVEAAATATADAAAQATRAAQATEHAIARATDDAAFTATAVVQATAVAAATATAEYAPTATALAREAALDAAVVVFQDSFDSNVNGWELEEDEDEYAYNVTSISDGKYTQSLWSYQAMFWREYVPELLVQDFYLSVEATVVETSAEEGNVNVSLAFREDEDGNYYRVRLRSNGEYKVYLRYEGEWITLQEEEASEAFRLEAGQSNTFAVLMQGDEFTLYANGQELTTLYDDRLSQAGKLSLGTGLLAAERSLTVDFDNLLVRQIPAEGEPVAGIKSTATARAQARATAEIESTVAAVARSTAIAGDTILFQDSFDSNANGWDLEASAGEYADGETRIENGKYVRTMTATHSVLWWESIPDLAVQDFYLSVEVTIVDCSDLQDADVALNFREDEDNNFYSVYFDAEGSYSVYLHRGDGEWVALRKRKPSPAIEQGLGASNTFAVLARGDEFTIYANGQELASVRDDFLSGPGEISLAIGLPEAGQTLTVEFDDIVVKALP